LMLPIVALLGFVGCNQVFGIEPTQLIPPPPPGPAPTNFVATAGDSRVDLTWDVYTGATEYYVKRGEVSGQYATAPFVLNTMQHPPYHDADVVNGTTYYYAVSARVDGIETENSEEQSATPMVSAGASDYFVTTFALGTSDNNYSGWAGMEIMVGANFLAIHEVGRVRAPGNVQQHAIKIVEKTTLTDLTTVILDTAGGTDGTMQTAPVPNPVTLNKNSSYYIISKEIGGGDLFYQDDSTIQTTGVATAVNAIKGDQIGPYIPSGGPNHCFGPLTFKYTVLA
jgi:hypothetical protein